MGKTLVLAEKPSVGRDLAKVLNCNQNSNGCLIGQKYIVTWALGHLVTLADPEAYDNKYKSWNLEDLPMLPDKMELAVIKETAKQYGIVRGLLKQPDVDELVIATDAGREGELVARWIIEKAGFRKPIKRLWISSQTDKAIKEGFSQLKPGKDYDNLYRAAQCRAEADWLIGLNVTRALTCKYNAQLSAGRVQTPTLAMIVQRENEIKNFVPKAYWTIEARVNGFSLIWRDRNSNNTQVFDKSKAEAIVAKLTGQTGEITDIKKEAKSEPHPLAYDLTELQRDANKRYGYSAKQTLSIMQTLYERHKVLTYPRTDSRHITTDIVPTLPDRLKSIAIGPYAAAAQSLLRNRINTTSRLVDNSKVSDHHAIIPTEQPVRLSELSQEERNIFDLVAKRFLAVLSPAYQYEQTTVKVEATGEQLFARGKVTKAMGWKAIYDDRNASDSQGDDEDMEQSLPPMQKGDKLKLLSVKSTNRKTKPPARFTEATLLTAMEHPGKLIEDESLREALDRTSGLGTPATRADIIEKLFNTFYIERRGKDIFPTAKGIQLIDLAPSELRSAELTAKWEQQLYEISKGKANAINFMNHIRTHAGKLVSAVVASTEAYRHDNMTRTRCPECGKFLLEVNGKKGKMLVCPDRECGYRKGIAQVSNARCPECHKRMELRGEGEGRLFTCSCGYREKLSSFNKRMEDRTESSDKRTVQRFIQQQKNEEPVNNAMADALAKWKATQDKK
ncbi:MAG TPA: DNA topoisomerase III [Negativicutes bacterium]|nr:DNA topoisomerase III [Negativicutes bacterium]